MSKTVGSIVFKSVIVFLFAWMVPAQSKAWSLLGHRIVGEVASTYLSPKAKKEVQHILGNESMAITSNWADLIKSDTSYKYLNPWHYIDVEKGLDFKAFTDSLHADTATNVYNKLNFVIAQLKNKSLPQSDKLLYLRLLIHMMGDIHQPLHVGRKGDRGGNDLKVSWFGEQSNMHKVWDDELITYQQLSYTEYTAAINYTTPQQRADWQKGGLAQWMFESYEISEKIHDDVKPNEKLSYNYNYKWYRTLNEQLLKGGVRLAGVLNEIFS